MKTNNTDNKGADNNNKDNIENKDNGKIANDIFEKPFSIEDIEEIINDKDNYEYIKDNNITIISYKTMNDGIQCFAVNSDYIYDEKEKQRIIIEGKPEYRQKHDKQLKEIIKRIGFQREYERKPLKILDFTHGNKYYKGSISKLNNENYDIVIYNFNESKKRIAPDLKEIDDNSKKSSKVFNRIMKDLSEYKIQKEITFEGVSMGVPYAFSKMKYIDKDKIKGQGGYKVNIVANGIPSFAGYIADPYKDTAKLFIEGISGNNGEFYNNIEKIEIKNDLGGIYHTNSDAEEFLKSVYSCFQINDNITSKDFEDFKKKIFVDDNLSNIKTGLDDEYTKDDNDIDNKDKKIENTKLSNSNQKKFIFISVLLAITIIGSVFILLVHRKMKEKQFAENEKISTLLDIKNSKIPKYTKNDIAEKDIKPPNV